MSVENSSASICIGRRTIKIGGPTFIIAEAGVNHNGEMKLAYQLIDAAVEAKADAVKFQLFEPTELVLASAPKTEYQKRNLGNDGSQLEMLKKLALSASDQQKLKAYAEERKIEFITTPFDEKSLEALIKMNPVAIKVASTDLTNLPFLKKVAEAKKPVILSTGMSFLEEVRVAAETVLKINKDLILLQCTANYPAADEEIHLRVMDSYREIVTLVGYSDHTVGHGASPYAVAAGALVIEKHFTLDRKMVGPDHSASLEPNELSAFVAQIRKVESYLGKNQKAPTPGEQNTRMNLQKYLVAKRELAKGTILQETDFIAMRTGGSGISPMKYQKIIGKKLKNDLAHHAPIEESMIEGGVN